MRCAGLRLRDPPPWHACRAAAATTIVCGPGGGRSQVPRGGQGHPHLAAHQHPRARRAGRHQHPQGALAAQALVQGAHAGAAGPRVPWPLVHAGRPLRRAARRHLRRALLLEQHAAAVLDARALLRRGLPPRKVRAAAGESVGEGAAATQRAAGSARRDAGRRRRLPHSLSRAGVQVAHLLRQPPGRASRAHPALGGRRAPAGRRVDGLHHRCALTASRHATHRSTSSVPQRA